MPLPFTCQSSTVSTSATMAAAKVIAAAVAADTSGIVVHITGTTHCIA